MQIGLIKGQRHCTLSLQEDLLGKVYVFQLVSQVNLNQKTKWSRVFEFDNMAAANQVLFDIESRYRNRGYSYCN